MKGKQAASAARKRAERADHDAAHWRARALDADAEARGWKRTAGAAHHRAEQLAVRVDDLEAALAAATSTELADARAKLAARDARVRRVVELFLGGVAEPLKNLRWTGDDWAEMKELLGIELFNMLPWPGSRDDTRYVVRRSPKDMRRLLPGGKG